MVIQQSLVGTGFSQLRKEGTNQHDGSKMGRNGLQSLSTRKLLLKRSNRTRLKITKGSYNSRDTFKNGHIGKIRNIDAEKMATEAGHVVELHKMGRLRRTKNNPSVLHLQEHPQVKLYSKAAMSDARKNSIVQFEDQDDHESAYSIASAVPISKKNNVSSLLGEILYEFNEFCGADEDRQEGRIAATTRDSRPNSSKVGECNNLALLLRPRDIIVLAKPKNIKNTIIDLKKELREFFKEFRQFFATE